MNSQLELDLIKSMEVRRELIREGLREQGYDLVDGVVTKIEEKKDETRPSN